MDIDKQLQSIKQKVTDAFLETTTLLSQDEFLNDWDKEYIMQLHDIARQLLQLKIKLG